MPKGKITISRYTSNQEPYAGITLKVVDELSGVEFLKVKITPEILGPAITGLSHQECSFELTNIDRVGKKREMKDECLTINPPYKDQKKFTA